jgi:hypothetical protein
LKPRKAYILVEVLPREFDKTIILLRHHMGEPDSPRFRRARVLEVGPLVEDVKKGDLVLIGQFAGLEVSDRIDIMQGREPDQRIMRVNEIEAVLEE